MVIVFVVLVIAVYVMISIINPAVVVDAFVGLFNVIVVHGNDIVTIFIGVA